jgi:hypothetical protein
MIENLDLTLLFIVVFFLLLFFIAFACYGIFEQLKEINKKLSIVDVKGKVSE